ncbi:60S ribosomal protein L37A [Purpureocillium lavendulum]|uniref:60S ribosomal protein L37A n=1 Tax=Purpureocillium lavendulum TaxID=1247861 RepID=A0AB34G5B0_9HYPO|nr:60S ribosomal protein L37A [Purpureocillium lavendulum]
MPADLCAHAGRGLDLVPRGAEDALDALADALVAEHDEEADDKGQQPRQQHGVAVEGGGELDDGGAQAGQDHARLGGKGLRRRGGDGLAACPPGPLLVGASAGRGAPVGVVAVGIAVAAARVAARPGAPAGRGVAGRLLDAVVDLAALPAGALLLEAPPLLVLVLGALAARLLHLPAQLVLLALALLALETLLLLLLLLEALEGLEKGLAALVVEDRRDADKLAGVVPLVVAQQDVQRVELEDLDAGVEVTGRVGAARAGGGGAVPVAVAGAGAWRGRRRGRRQLGGEVEVGRVGRGEVRLEPALVQGLVAGVRQQQRGSELVDDDVRVDVALDAVVSVADDLLPDLAVADLGAQGTPLLVAKGVLALVGLHLEDGVEDGQVQAPDLDAGGAGGGGDGGGLAMVGGAAGGHDEGREGGEGLGEAAREEEGRGLAMCEVWRAAVVDEEESDEMDEERRLRAKGSEAEAEVMHADVGSGSQGGLCGSVTDGPCLDVGANGEPAAATLLEEERSAGTAGGYGRRRGGYRVDDRGGRRNASDAAAARTRSPETQTATGQRKYLC